MFPLPVARGSWYWAVPATVPVDVVIVTGSVRTCPTPRLPLVGAPETFDWQFVKLPRNE
jgi:hypothetical protein